MSNYYGGLTPIGSIFGSKENSCEDLDEKNDEIKRSINNINQMDFEYKNDYIT
jgi:hypothetical protein